MSAGKSEIVGDRSSSKLHFFFFSRARETIENRTWPRKYGFRTTTIIVKKKKNTHTRTLNAYARTNYKTYDFRVNIFARKKWLESTADRATPRPELQDDVGRILTRLHNPEHVIAVDGYFNTLNQIFYSRILVHKLLLPLLCARLIAQNKPRYICRSLTNRICIYYTCSLIAKTANDRRQKRPKTLTFSKFFIIYFYLLASRLRVFFFFESK